MIFCKVFTKMFILAHLILSWPTKLTPETSVGVALFTVYSASSLLIIFCKLLYPKYVYSSSNWQQFLGESDLQVLAERNRRVGSSHGGDMEQKYSSDH